MFTICQAQDTAVRGEMVHLKPNAEYSEVRCLKRHLPGKREVIF